ncbi:hypothetical protein FRB90_000307, partial [Tulasnella sp. 427]
MPVWHFEPRLGPPAHFESQDNSIVYIITKNPQRYLDVVEKNAVLQKVMLAAVLIAVWDWLNKLDDEAFLYAVDLLLAYRALCLYRMKRNLVIANIILFTVSLIAWIVIIVTAYGGFKAIPTPRFLSGCWSSLGAFIFLSAIPGLLFELWLFILVGYRMLVYSKSVGWNRNEILDLIMKDAVSWFLVIQGLILLNAFSLSVMPMGMRTFALP